MTQDYSLVQISRGGVAHRRHRSGKTLCGKAYSGGGVYDGYTISEIISCKSCIKIENRDNAVPVKIEAAMQAEGVRLRRDGKALMGNIPTESGEAAKLAFVHGWMSLHESCECKISGGAGHTLDLATHEMVKNPPARQYTAAEDYRAQRRYGLIAPSWQGKRKGSKAKRQLSNA